MFGLRQLEHSPPHFTQITFDIRVTQKHIADWIWENLEGRFWIGDYYYTTDTGSISFMKSVSFERSAEASMFALILDQINTPITFY